MCGVSHIWESTVGRVGDRLHGFDHRGDWAGHQRGIETEGEAITLQTGTTSCRVQVTTHPGYGAILADAERTIRYSLAQGGDSESFGSGDCAEVWPPLTVERSPAVTRGHPGILHYRTRQGTLVTYDGPALYDRTGDAEPGDATGHGAGDVSFVMDPACLGETTRATETETEKR
jgi:predicted lipoprotein with Yx(FWY)xxD motif